MKHLSRHSSLFMLFAGTALLVACTVPPAPPPPALQAAPPLEIPVHKETTQHTLQVGPRGQVSSLERSRLSAFIADLAGSRPEALHVVVSGARPGEDLGRVVKMLVSDGVDPAKIGVARTQATAGTAIVTISVDKYVATPPVCEPWKSVSSADYENNAARPDLGCSDLNNLGAMIADPNDLVQGTSSRFADGTTAASAVRRYHEDNVKDLPALSGFKVTAPSSGGGGAGASTSAGTSGGM